MARKNSSAISEEELLTAAPAPHARSFNDDSPLDARMLDLDDEAESPFLRAQKRVAVRRGALPRNAEGRVKLALKWLAMAAFLAVVGLVLQNYATGSWRFRLDSSDNIAVAGMHNVTRSQIIDVMASDIDRNIFFVPLAARKKQLEQIPWVQSAAIMRLLPNRLKIVVVERTPVAFIDINSHIELIDGDGVIMEMPANQANASRYSFPVVVGTSDAEPLSVRAARMRIYTRFIKDLDSSGAHYSADISDVDLSDPDDVKATVTDPHGAVLVHLGATNFLQHFQVYVTHIQEWRAQFQNLESVSLRFDHQVVLNPDAARGSVRSTGDSKATAAAESKPAPEHKKSTRKPRKHT